MDPLGQVQEQQETTANDEALARAFQDQIDSEAAIFQSARSRRSGVPTASPNDHGGGTGGDIALATAIQAQMVAEATVMRHSRQATTTTPDAPSQITGNNDETTNDEALAQALQEQYRQASMATVTTTTQGTWVQSGPYQQQITNNNNQNSRRLQLIGFISTCLLLGAIAGFLFLPFGAFGGGTRGGGGGGGSDDEPTTSAGVPTFMPTMEPTGMPTFSPIPDGPTALTRAANGSLCSLFWRKDNNDGSGSEVVKQVGRSYNGRDWEATAGDFAALTFNCTSDSAETDGCQVVLPPLEEGEVYQPVCHGESAIVGGAANDDDDEEEDLARSVDDIIARFLEQATFGATPADLQALRLQHLDQQADEDEDESRTLTNFFASWMRKQMDPSITAPTLHREFFRRRLSSRFDGPTEMGVVTHPCGKGARFRLFSFTEKDDNRQLQLETLSNILNRTDRIIRVNGHLRTTASSVTLSVGGNNEEVPDGSFQICESPLNPFLDESESSEFKLYLPDHGCIEVAFDGVYGNPPVQFEEEIAFPRYLIDLDAIGAVETDKISEQRFSSKTPRVQEVVLTKDLWDDVPECLSLFPKATGVEDDEPVFAQWDGRFWIHDPQFVLQENTVMTPLDDGGGSMVASTRQSVDSERSVLCSTAPRTFINEAGCQLALGDDVCASAGNEAVGGDIMVELSVENLRRIYRATGGNGTSTGEQEEATPTARYLYAIDNLALNEMNPSPCMPLSTSRWVRGRCGGSDGSSPPPSISENTRNTLITHLSNSNDNNPYMRDILMPSRGTVCDEGDLEKRGMEITVDGTCWKQVHPLHLQVYDMTYWTERGTHPGNMVSDREPIKEFAWDDSFVLIYPRASHGMDRWEEHERHFANIGRLGDAVPLNTFPETLLTYEVAEAFDAIDVVRGSSAVVCGTPGEVENTIDGVVETDVAFRGRFDAATRVDRTASSSSLENQRKEVWTTIAIQSSDQLRQRMAWALSQILVIATDDLEAGEDTESFLSYYDIFVRHAFGNYRDILMEVAYSPLMGEMLTYLDSKSTSYQWEASDATKLEFPDENMAREVMQLFSTGLYKMSSNGNRILENGSSVRVYLNDDVEEYSRVWTGFRRQPRRGNIEGIGSNRIDPMFIEPAWRDQFPKMGLEGTYIGDRYPLCSDLPKRHFLSRGAKYRRVLSTGQPEVQRDPMSWGSTESPQRLRATPNGELYLALCDRLGGIQCQYPMNVVLDDTLQCSGEECEVDTVRTIELDDGVFYEYIRYPCVEQAFYADAKKIVGITYNSPVLCADPRMAVASAACCTQTTCCTALARDGFSTFIANSSNQKYWGERLNFQTASSRCGTMCDFPDLQQFCQTVGGCSVERSSPSMFWTTASCQLMAKIDPSDGTVAIVHQAENVPNNKIAKQVQEDTKSFFRVHWNKNGAKVSVSEAMQDLELNAACITSVDGGYLCPLTVQEDVVYNESYQPTSPQQAYEELRIGALPPDIISVGPISKAEVNGVIFHNFGSGSLGNPGNARADSIIEVVDDFGRTHFLKNKRSRVQVVGSQLSFRNPPHFIGLSDRETRDMEYETVATIDQYLFNHNTAPFLAIRLAQRFGMSNPSPSYIATIAEAFRSGKYLTFGTSKYGDLEAALAAILLSPEARDPILDLDYGQGSLKEPLLKLIGLMRALDFRPHESRPLTSFKSDLQQLIGQEAHELPSVFSFFRPEYKLSGSRAADGGLVTPEGAVLTTPKIVSFMNGIFSLLRYGLDECFGGFGDGGGRRSCNMRNNYGRLSYKPSPTASGRIVDELSTLLTSGRLNRKTRRVATRLYDSIPDKDDALILTQQLIVSSPEFHTTGRVRRSGDSRRDSASPTRVSTDYKAIVVVMLDGGYDSWNMLVPHSCDKRNAEFKTVREQYNDERGLLGFIESERTRIISVDEAKQRLEQPCTEFVVHDELQIVKELYDQGDLSFFVNLGVLNRPVNKLNYNSQTETQLFAHNAMQWESERLDPFGTLPNTGILGRTLDALSSSNLRSNSLSVDSLSVSVQGTAARAPDTTVVSRSSNQAFNPSADKGSKWDLFDEMNEVNDASRETSNVYAEVWSDRFMTAMNEADELKEFLDDAELEVPLGPIVERWDRTMELVSKLIHSRDRRGVDRDVIHASLGNWDHHSEMKNNLRANFQDLNRVLTHFASEMKALDLWNNVTLVLVSEFSRTLTPNSGAGSDHAWGGHYFAMGGQLNGGQLHGQYPFDITANGRLNIGRGRGRLIPELAWESMWNGIVQWFGVENESDLDHIFPNREGTGAVLFNKEDLYEMSQ